MNRKDRHLAIDLLEKAQNGTFLEWSRINLSDIEAFPWRSRKMYPVGNLANRHASIIEIMGLSTAGKSSLVEFLKKSLPRKGVRASVIEEFHLAGPIPKILLKTSVVQEARTIRKQLGLEMQNLLLENLKFYLLTDAFRRNINLSYKDAKKGKLGKPILSVIERGPNDALASLSWVNDLAASKQILPKSMEEDIAQGDIKYDTARYVHPGYVDRFHESFLYSIAFSSFVSAVILYGVSWETTKARRLAMGLPAEGSVVNELNRKFTEEAYGWWLGSWFPLFRKRYGTGLLVVDGENNLKENNKMVLDYLLKISRTK